MFYLFQYYGELHIFNPFKKIIAVSVFVLVILNISTSFTQNLSKSELDSVYVKFLQLRAPELLKPTDVPVKLTKEDRKCGFGIVSQVRLNLNNFTPEQQSVLKVLLQRPTKQTSMVSPSRRFRIHYDSTGAEVPNYDPSMTVEENVMQVALALDSSYNFEVIELGYPAPPPDNGAGGDDLYDFYITSALGAYGFTDPEIHLGDEKYTSFIEIHYNFQGPGFATHGLNAMRVTVAHELHHAIQMGNYILRSDDVYFYELTSTSMEEFVYDDVNDYYQYMVSYFRRPDRAFPLNSGYNLALWNIYLKENFGFDIIKEQWELMPNQRAISAINNSITNSGSIFPFELNKFGIWTYFTNYKAVPGLYFEEAANYPLITPTSTIQFTAPSELVQMNASPTANNFVKFFVSSIGDTLFAIVTNGDAISAASNPSQFFNFDYTLFSDASSGVRNLTDNYSSTFSVENSSFWSVSEILNDQVVRQDTSVVTPTGGISNAYPNPFRYSRSYLTGSLIFIPLDFNIGETADFNVYTSGLQLVKDEAKNIQNIPGDRRGISWNGFDNDNQKLASGVYIYVIKRGDDVEKGKIVIFNE